MDFFDYLESLENTDDITGLTVGNFGLISQSSDTSDSGNSVVPVQDVTDRFLTNEELPPGDFRINMSEGIDTDIEVVDLGEINSSLSNIFDFNPTNSFSSSFEDIIQDAIIEFFTNEFISWF